MPNRKTAAIVRAAKPTRRYATHKSTTEGKALTLTRRDARRTKYATEPLSI